MLKINKQELSQEENRKIKRFNKLEEAILKKIDRLNKKYKKADRIRQELNDYLESVQKQKEDYETHIMNTTHAGSFEFIKSQIPELNFNCDSLEESFYSFQGNPLDKEKELENKKVDLLKKFKTIEENIKIKSTKQKAYDSFESVTIEDPTTVSVYDEPIDLNWEILSGKLYGKEIPLSINEDIVELEKLQDGLDFFKKSSLDMKSIYENVNEHSYTWKNMSTTEYRLKYPTACEYNSFEDLTVSLDEIEDSDENDIIVSNKDERGFDIITAKEAEIFGHPLSFNIKEDTDEVCSDVYTNIVYMADKGYSSWDEETVNEARKYIKDNNIKYNPPKPEINEPIYVGYPEVFDTSDINIVDNELNRL